MRILACFAAKWPAFGIPEEHRWRVALNAHITRIHVEGIWQSAWHCSDHSPVMDDAIVGSISSLSLDSTASFESMMHTHTASMMQYFSSIAACVPCTVPRETNVAPTGPEIRCGTVIRVADAPEEKRAKLLHLIAMAMVAQPVGVPCIHRWQAAPCMTVDNPRIFIAIFVLPVSASVAVSPVRMLQLAFARRGKFVAEASGPDAPPRFVYSISDEQPPHVVANFFAPKLGAHAHHYVSHANGMFSFYASDVPATVDDDIRDIAAIIARMH